MDELAASPGISVKLVVSRRQSLGGTKPYTIRNAMCVPCLLPRRNLGRFGNFFIVIGLLYKLCKSKQGDSCVILFVRNDPILLFAASLFNRFVHRIVFQSSFPHERVARYFKRWLTCALFYMSSRNVDSFLAVSPLGMKRLQNIFPSKKYFSYIPLLPDVILNNQCKKESFGPPVKFIYSGSHDKIRNLEVLLMAIVDAVHEAGFDMHFLFLGARNEDVDRFVCVPGVQDLVEKKILTFKEPVPRREVWCYMKKADVGLSLIPPLDIYREASPTKVVEYFSSGLAVLASYGIEMQESLIHDSNGGVLVAFDKDSIYKGLISIAKDKAKIKLLCENSYKYAQKNLSYSSYLSLFKTEVLGVCSSE